MPDISIVTPSFNQGRFIERTIRSVLEQEFDGRALEYVVVDGASTDDTVEVLQRFGKRLSWVSEPDRGQAHAVNKGLAMTSGQIIGWLNSDDIYYPGAFRSIWQCFAAHPEVDLVYGDANHIGTDDAVLEPYYTEPWDFERLKDVCYLCQPAVFFRRRLFQRIGGMDERLHFCMDYDYWVRAALSEAHFEYLPITLAGSRWYPENKTVSGWAASHAEINDVLLRRLGYVPDRWIFNYAHVVLRQSRLREEDRLRFTILVSALSMYASLRWNHRITPGVLGTVRHWVGGTVRSSLQQAWAR
ncbi:MAG: glycosyltransferase [Chloroflexi bacterium]|nr:glycosyltransferase [Chloroflexota bacterium]MBV9595286.1 glycosyltransferase [Chloroflexota bacterium]